MTKNLYQCPYCEKNSLERESDITCKDCEPFFNRGLVLLEAHSSLGTLETMAESNPFLFSTSTYREIIQDLSNRYIELLNQLGEVK